MGRSTTKGTTNKKDIIEIVLSIILAASVAHVLNLFAIYISEEKLEVWILSSTVVIWATIAIICHVLDVPIKNLSTWLKTLFIYSITMTIFGFSRFIYFVSEKISSTNQLSYSSFLWFFIVSGAVLIGQGFSDKKKKWLKWWGIAIIVVSLIFLYILLEPLGIGQVTK